MKQKKSKFVFSDSKIKLVPTVGIFFTMNPHYRDRNEIPRNLRELYRPCAMVYPDLDIISEILLVSEGFMLAKTLSKKIVIFYEYSNQLLSKQVKNIKI